MNVENALEHTPLFEEHASAGAKLVPFAGWLMPVLYEGVIAEHLTVRKSAGLFDVSHMGEIDFTGPQAQECLQAMTCNDVTQLKNGKAQYSAITNHAGGVVDDIIIYRFDESHFLVCVNAANTEKDFRWFTQHNIHECTIVDRSRDFGQIALQGPKAIGIFERYCGESIHGSLKNFHFKEMTLGGINLIVARTGYTGEDGLELFVPWSKTPLIWRELLEMGADQGLRPIGLGARDTLRLEACLSLYGHELGDDISPIESGIGWIVKLNCGEFIGRAPIEEHILNGAPRKLVGFVIEGQGIARQGDEIINPQGETIGVVTSGTKTPTVNQALGLALVRSEFADLDSQIVAQVRGRAVNCRVVKTPFYRRSS